MTSRYKNYNFINKKPSKKHFKNGYYYKIYLLDSQNYVYMTDFYKNVLFNKNKNKKKYRVYT